MRDVVARNRELEKLAETAGSPEAHAAVAEFLLSLPERIAHGVNQPLSEADREKLLGEIEENQKRIDQIPK